MRTRLLFTLATAAVVAACAAPQRPAPIDVRPEVPPLGGRCEAGPAQSVIGKMGTASNVEAARVASGSLMARTVSPGQMMTKEFSPDRLNLMLDAKGKIIGANCG